MDAFPQAIKVEAVTPRRIGGFRVNLGAAAGAALQEAPWIRSCVVVPPNLYFDVTLERLVALLCEELTPQRHCGYTQDPALVGKTVNVAFCSPNANKPLHLGHGRNMMLGAAISNLLEAAGACVRRSCCISDYGMHIFKAVAAYLRHGGTSTPESTGDKADHFVGRFYAGYAADPTLAYGPGSPSELMRDWMRGSDAVRNLTRTLSSWAEAGFDETFDEWQIRFDHRFYETQEHAYIEAFLTRQIRDGRVHRDDAGRLVVELEREGSIVSLTRSDGSPLYMSHMIAAILQRIETFGPRVQVLMTLTGEEQVVPFRQLSAVLEEFGYASHVELRHVTHGMVRAAGRGLSSREGTSLTLDRVVDELVEARGAHEEPQRERARVIVALYLLSRSMEKPIDYSATECLRLGTRIFLDVANTLRITGQAYAGSLPQDTSSARFDRWLMKLAAYPVILHRAVGRLDPPFLLNYLAELCHEFVALHRTGQVCAQLFPPTRCVVEHALELLNLPADEDVFAAPGPAATRDQMAGSRR